MKTPMIKAPRVAARETGRRAAAEPLEPEPWPLPPLALVALPPDEEPAPIETFSASC